MTNEFGPYYHPFTARAQTMMPTTELHAGDPLLLPFLEAAGDDAATAALGILLGGEADRVIQQTVRRELTRSSAGARHVDDVAGEVRLRLVRRLWSLRRAPHESIDNFLGYVATTAEYACYAFLRLQLPERSRFRNRLRYALSHQSSTALVRDESGVWWCTTRRPVRRAPTPGATQALVDNPREWLAVQGIDLTQPLPALVDAVLSGLDGRIELDRLVDALCAALGVADLHRPGSRDRAGIEPAEMADPTPVASVVLEHREALTRTWGEIVALPARQRAALLLNLRDPEGGAILHMLPSTGVVSQAGIATALDLTPAALTALWERLPLDDLAIASALGLTRQQVINLRKSARARLARRLKEPRS